MSLRPDGFDAPVGELLLATYPLLRLMRGDKRDFMKEAWMRAALSLAGRHLNCEEGRLPQNPREAVFALYEAVMELGEAAGVTRPEFADAFNLRGEGVRQGVPERADEIIERTVALLSVFMARRLEAR